MASKTVKKTEPKKPLKDLPKPIKTKTKTAIFFSHRKFIETFTTLYEPDIKLDVNDTIFNVHKIIIITHSPIFRSMFDDKFKVDSTPKLDHDPKIFSLMIDLLYCKQIDLKFDDLLSLLKLVDYYDITELIKKLEEEILELTTVDNVYSIYKQISSKKNKLKSTRAICDYLFTNTPLSEPVTNLLKTITDENDMNDIIKLLIKEKKNSVIKTLMIPFLWYRYYKERADIKKIEITFETKKLNAINKLSEEVNIDYGKLLDLLNVTKDCPILNRFLSNFKLNLFMGYDLIYILEPLELFNSTDIHEAVFAKVSKGLVSGSYLYDNRTITSKF